MGGEDPATVPPLDLAAVDPATFCEQEAMWAYMLVHLPTVANPVVMEGEHRGFIDIPVWRRERDNRPHNARVTIDPGLHQRTVDAARRAIQALLTHPNLIAHGKRFSNQYPGFWGGALAFLSAHEDRTLRRQLTDRIRAALPDLSSPAGYHSPWNARGSTGWLTMRCASRTGRISR